MAIVRKVNRGEEGLCSRCFHRDVCKATNNQPCIECNQFADRSKYVVREKGEWVYDHWCEFKCSKCGALSKTEPRGEENFCPNCGADMRKGENG